MKTLRDHTLIYDQDCPMCRVYTSAFIRRKWLDGEGRSAYQQLDLTTWPQLDAERARNEIALINRQTGAVTYGPESLTAIFMHRHPFLKPLLQSGVLQFMLRPLYSFISYNRKVIAAIKPTGRSCSPSFNLPYRIAYLLFAWYLTSLILTCYTPLMAGIVPAGNGWREYLICAGQMVFQGCMLMAYRRPLLWEYLGNVMTVSLMGAIALLPALLAGRWLHQPLLFTLYFLMVAGGMLLEHLRRMSILGLGWLPSATWVLYRVLVLICVLLIGR